MQPRNTHDITAGFGDSAACRPTQTHPFGYSRGAGSFYWGPPSWSWRRSRIRCRRGSLAGPAGRLSLPAASASAEEHDSPPSDSRPRQDLHPGGMSSVSRTSPVRGSTRLKIKSLSSPSQVPCQSSPSTPVNPPPPPVTKPCTR